MDFKPLQFRQLPGDFMICRLPVDSPLPPLAATDWLISVTRTVDELSIVCSCNQAPAAAMCEGPWKCFKLRGPFPFSLTGVLASFIDPLAVNGVPIFAISTFETDYVLVKEADAAKALRTLEAAGHELIA
jgi:uncharacterized protein